MPNGVSKPDVQALGVSGHADGRDLTYLDTLYRKYDGSLRRFLVQHLNSSEEVSDVAQEVYLRIGNSRVQKDISHPRAFLITVAINLLRDRFRRNRLRKTFPHVPIDNVDVVSPEPLADRALDASERLKLVLEAVFELSPKCRRAFLLHRFEGMTYEEIATEMGISRSMVRKYVYRTLAHCRDRLLTENTSGKEKDV